MKTKYEKMSKKEKKETLKMYKETPNGKEMIMRLYRLNFIGIALILYAIGMLIIEYKGLELVDYLFSMSLFFIGSFFLFASYRLRKKVLNIFAIKKK